MMIEGIDRGDTTITTKSTIRLTMIPAGWDNDIKLTICERRMYYKISRSVIG